MWIAQFLVQLGLQKTTAKSDKDKQLMRNKILAR